MRELAPFPSDGAAALALAATVETLTELLTVDERLALAEALPPPLSYIARRREPGAGGAHGSLFEGVAAKAGLSSALGLEEAEIACRVIGESAGPDVRARLRLALPEAGHFFVPPRPPTRPDRVDATGRHHDLAEGRPGGSHPLATANPATLAHRHSVARSDDPHGESKLSGARGLTQEREENSLASGRPGSKRPLSSDH